MQSRGLSNVSFYIIPNHGKRKFWKTKNDFIVIRPSLVHHVGTLVTCSSHHSCMRSFSEYNYQVVARARYSVSESSNLLQSNRTHPQGNNGMAGIS
jgi:hypothetical protein